MISQVGRLGKQCGCDPALNAEGPVLHIRVAKLLVVGVGTRAWRRSRKRITERWWKQKLSREEEGRVRRKLQVVPHVIVVENARRCANHGALIARTPCEAQPWRKVVEVVIHKTFADIHSGKLHAVALRRPQRLLVYA